MSSIAEERVERKLGRAESEGLTDITTALAIAEAFNVSIPERYRLRICDGCSSLLHPGKNAEVRTGGGLVKYKCRECGAVNRHGY